MLKGTTGDESLSKLGMVVGLSGSDHGKRIGKAVSIDFLDNVEGAVIANNVTCDGSLNIMGLTIQINEDSVFNSNVKNITSLEGINVGNIVEVNGYSTGDNSILATRIEVKKLGISHGDDIELNGLITNLTETSFVISDLTIDYTNAVLDQNLVVGLANDMFVKVKTDSAIDGFVLYASEIELKNILGNRQLKNQRSKSKTDITEGIE